MKYKTKKGFTLIELLVVIAIIALLSSVILASLNSAKNSGADATVKADFNSIKKQAELVYSNVIPNSYAGVCSDSTVIRALSDAVYAEGSVWNSVSNDSRDYNCTNALGTWVVVSKLKSGGWLCADNTLSGSYVTEPSQPGLIITVCP